MVLTPAVAQLERLDLLTTSVMECLAITLDIYIPMTRLQAVHKSVPLLSISILTIV